MNSRDTMQPRLGAFSQATLFMMLFVTSQIVVLIAVGLLVSIMWGSGQIFQPATLQGRLSANMTVAEVEGALALPPGSLADRMETIDKNILSVRLADSGVGSWFIPQYAIALIFDSEMRLQKCLIELHWRADEINVPFAI